MRNRLEHAADPLLLDCLPGVSHRGTIGGFGGRGETPEVAPEFAAAREAEKAADFTRGAAERVAAYEHALELAERAGWQGWTSAWLNLGTARARTGDYEGAIDAYQRYLSHEAPEPAVSRKAQCLAGLAAVECLTGRFESALEILDRPDYLESSPISRIGAAERHALRVYCLRSLGRDAAADAETNSFLSWLDESPPEVSVQLRGGLVTLYYAAGDLEASLEQLKIGVGESEDGSQMFIMVARATSQGEAAVRAGDREHALRFLNACDWQDLDLETPALELLGELADEVGEVASAATLLRLAVARSASSNDRERAWLHYSLGRVLAGDEEAVAGDVDADEALREFRAGLVRADASGDEQAISYLSSSVGCRLIQLGNRAEARDHLDRAEQLFERLGDDEGVEIARKWRDGAPT